MARRESGFTLIELMITVAIIGILASIAMPAFRDHVARAKVSEALVRLSDCRTLVQEVYQSGGSWPGIGNWGCEAENPSQYIERITTTENGTIIVTMGGKVGDLRLSQKDVTMAPLNSSNALMTELDMGTAVRRWRCGSPADGTDLSPSFLPASCRGG